MTKFYLFRYSLSSSELEVTSHSDEVSKQADPVFPFQLTDKHKRNKSMKAKGRSGNGLVFAFMSSAIVY